MFLLPHRKCYLLDLGTRRAQGVPRGNVVLDAYPRLGSQPQISAAASVPAANRKLSVTRDELGWRAESQRL